MSGHEKIFLFSCVCFGFQNSIYMRAESECISKHERTRKNIFIFVCVFWLSKLYIYESGGGHEKIFLFSCVCFGFQNSIYMRAESECISKHERTRKNIFIFVCVFWLSKLYIYESGERVQLLSSV